MIFNFLKRLFNNQPKKSVEQIKIEHGLKKWDDLRWVHQAFIGDIITNCNPNDLAVALNYCEKSIYKKFLHIAKSFHSENSSKLFSDDLEELIKKHSKVTKEQSDKIKAHITNNILHPDYIKYRNLPYGHSPRKN